jgi:hypothetical protein
VSYSQVHDYATWDGNLEESRERKKSNREQIAYISKVGVLSRGQTDRIGAVRSQPAIRVLFAPDLMLMKHKIPYIMKSEKWLLESTLKMWEWFARTKFETYDSEIVLPKDIIGYDELLQAQTDQIEIASGMTDITDVLRVQHPEMTEAELKTLAEKIDKEKKEKIENSMNGQQQAISQGNE